MLVIPRLVLLRLRWRRRRKHGRDRKPWPGVTQASLPSVWWASCPRCCPLGAGRHPDSPAKAGRRYPSQSPPIEMQLHPLKCSHTPEIEPHPVSKGSRLSFVPVLELLQVPDSIGWLSSRMCLPVSARERHAFASSGDHPGRAMVRHRQVFTMRSSRKANPR